ncbi:amino acid permease [Paenibacillus sp. BR2-3]|uniref:amino acid permease n=1 Tax=Paenibacillus sp. BR2-3 TaxID=3048494 RepID=UPI0039778CD4
MANVKKQELSTFHLTMLALGTVVGGSFFLGSGVAIKAAGPSIIISYLLGGLLIYIVLYALSEMTVADPVPGSFRTYAERSFGPGVGFITGWVYWTGLIFAMSSESIAASTFLRLWFPNISAIVMGVMIIIAVTLLNLLGARHLSRLESGLAVVKLLAIAGFIAVGLAIIAGVMPGAPAVGAGELRGEPWFPRGIAGIAGSMLIVIFTYAGFEVIGLATSEVRDPRKTIPRAINFTLILLVGLYVGAIAVILPLFPTQGIIEDQSPLVLALSRWGMNWAGTIINIVMITAILSTMLASTFGLGRMIRSLAAEGHAPSWLKDKSDIPYKGILFSGAAMLGGLSLGFILPQYVYLFLISSGGFSLLFAYFVILASHYKWRKNTPCSPAAFCQLPGFPYTSWLGLIGIIGIMVSMPFIPGQAAGLIAGLLLIVFFAGLYIVRKTARRPLSRTGKSPYPNGILGRMDVPHPQMEAAEEYIDTAGREQPNKPKS